jgi:hypothetical protein
MEITLDQSDLGSSWGTLFTYSSPEEKEEIITSLESNLDNLKQRNLGELDEFDPTIGAVNCVDISDQKEIILAEVGAGKQVMGWVKAHKMVLLCKTWEWNLLQSRDGRWTSHLDVVYESDKMSFTRAAERLIEKQNISDRGSRQVIHEFLEQRSLFTEFLNEEGLSPTKLQSIIDSKGLWSLNDTERDLLLRPNDELLRYVAAQELRDRRGGRFVRQDFIQLFGEIPRRINLQSDDQIFEDILEGISLDDRSFREITEIPVLAGVLRIDNFENRLELSIRELIEQDIEALYTEFEEIENETAFLDRSEYICKNLESSSLKSIFAALSTIVSLNTIGQGAIPLDILERYRTQVDSEDKEYVTEFLAEAVSEGKFHQSHNHNVVADFLDEEGPKIVILLDGLPLIAPETEQFLSDRKMDQRWEFNKAVAPVPTITKVFMPLLSQEFDFEYLGGFSNGEDRLTGIDLDAFLGDEREDELLEMLQAGQSVILYNTEIDQGAHYPTDIHRKIETHLRENIPEFVDKYGDLADILITSDHGMVETYESEAIPRPSEANQRGMRHCRGTFADNIEDVQDELSDVNVSYIEVGLPDNDEDCIMINPNNPNAKFGTQNSDLWIHGGVSMEESIVPVAVRRRD